MYVGVIDECDSAQVFKRYLVTFCQSYLEISQIGGKDGKAVVYGLLGYSEGTEDGAISRKDPFDIFL